MRRFDGVGLAAPQIEKSIRLLVCEFQPKEGEELDKNLQPFPLTVLVNPVITKYSKDEVVFDEGCLSFLGLEMKISRPREVNVLAQDQTGKKIKIRAKGLFARILQHEIDHLNGILFPDYAKDVKNLRHYMALKSVFLGTPQFAVPSLEALVVNGIPVTAVITEPDKPAGRGQKLTSPPVKTVAQEFGLPVFQPQSKEELTKNMSEIDPHYLIVAAYGKILPKKILDLVPYGSINIHPSLLPKYRGASPIQTAIIDGLNQTGITLMRMDENMDTGDIIIQKPVSISPDDTTESLSENLAIEGANLLVDTLGLYLTNQIQPTPQDKTQATYTKPIQKEDGEIDWKDKPEVIERKIRAYNPWPKATAWLIDNRQPTTHNKKRLIIHKAHIVKGKLIPDIVQLEGKKPTNWPDFLRGYQDSLPRCLQ